MKIGIDVDNVINNLTECVISVYNEDTGSDLKLTDIIDYDITLFVKPELRKNFYQYFSDDRVWKRLQIKDGAADCIENLAKTNEVYFVTSTYPENVYRKAEWLSEHIRGVDIDKRLIICHNKPLLSELDILFDDYEPNLRGSYMGIIMNYAWNQCPNHRNMTAEEKVRWLLMYRRVDSWSEFQSIVETTNSALNKIATELTTFKESGLI